MGYDTIFFRSLVKVLSGEATSDSPLQFIARSNSCRRTLYLTKWWWLQYLCQPGETITAMLPKYISVFHGTSLPTIGDVRKIRVRLRTLDTPFLFVGDLDPSDLTTYAALRVGGIKRESSAEQNMKVEYLGIGDAWLELCQRSLREKRSRSSRIPQVIKMTKHEVENLRWLETLDLDWQQIVGPQSMDLLRDGWKLELEGATNPLFFRTGFAADVRAMLFGVERRRQRKRRRVQSK